ncbi:MAG TPA: malonate decarboxylase subunit delta [Noviherbaspirillum sp.]
MEKIFRQYPAGAPASRRALAGVVGSGDLEVLLEPNSAGTTTIEVNTSVNGKGQTWNAVLSRIFSVGGLPAMKIEINDCGATPGVVRMRIEQAIEEARQP